MIELTKGSLPWKHLESRDEIGQLKEKCRGESIKLLMGGCPKEYVTILDYIDNICYYHTPDYNLIRQHFKTALQINNLNEYPYDWENQPHQLNN
uniref:Uncharacterized protein n=1 Tax=Panagrolaimus sp. PS1159 TaxID=55785 RepID=A0AC35GM39_9BILA